MGFKRSLLQSLLESLLSLVRPFLSVLYFLTGAQHTLNYTPLTRKTLVKNCIAPYLLPLTRPLLNTLYFLLAQHLVEFTPLTRKTLIKDYVASFDKNKFYKSLDISAEDWTRILDEDYPADNPGRLHLAKCVRFKGSGKVAGVIMMRRVADLMGSDHQTAESNDKKANSTTVESTAMKILHIAYRTSGAHLSHIAAPALSSSYYLGPVYASPNLSKWERLLFLSALSHFFDAFEGDGACAKEDVQCYTVAAHPTIESMAKAFGGTAVKTWCFDDEDDWVFENEGERRLWRAVMGKYEGMRSVSMYRFVR
ncbi:hypothetical protein HK102_004463 [Quaeritorhiza haematococci]|nr:hypothetical protein HK102_004463 [Quaeritorhiza haematococci]